MTERTVLISGASIAGPTLAFWLRRHGLRPVVVERADGLRLGGQNVDVRGPGREVARRMGIEDEIRAATTGERGVRFVDRDDVTKAAFPAGTSDSDGFTAELEVLRGDLARILYEQTRATTEYVFGDSITGLREHDDRITASFAKGEDRDFDVVIAADGIRSRTRGLVFGDEVEIKELGLYTAYLTIPRAPSDSAWARWYNAPGCRSMTLRPDNVGTTRATLSFMGRPRGYERLEFKEQKQILRRVFGDAGWEAPRVLAALDESEDMYFEATGQVRAPQWSRGRFALVGDAGYCASPISGKGTSLALAGAYVLAGELGRHADHRAAFAAYEALMRPYVEQAQELPPGAPRIAHPKTRLGVTAFNTAVWVASQIAKTGLARKLASESVPRIELPDYGALLG